jgi:hypothetical protein
MDDVLAWLQITESIVELAVFNCDVCLSIMEVNCDETTISIEITLIHMEGLFIVLTNRKSFSHYMQFSQI